ncbi:GIY-YIG nuclease family protein [Streptomyces goshikiensis]|uniref:GIY-YIG nuclease family protein n=1 Tax=Streptomyces goshikiensis TaxID=1942 RepID=UPI0036516A1F
MTLSNPAPSDRPAAVYRLFASDGTLLYIGSAYHPEERAKAHQHKEWGPLVARRTDEWHVTREDAYEAEGQAIQSEDPAHNMVGTSRYTGPAEQGRAMREASDARWRVAVAAVRAGASEKDAREAGGWAEVEYLEASGVLPAYAVKLRGQILRGGTSNSRSMSLPGCHKGKLTWEMGPRELRAAYADGVRGSAHPPVQRTNRINE